MDVISFGAWKTQFSDDDLGCRINAYVDTDVAVNDGFLCERHKKLGSSSMQRLINIFFQELHNATSFFN